MRVDFAPTDGRTCLSMNRRCGRDRLRYRGRDVHVRRHIRVSRRPHHRRPTSSRVKGPREGCLSGRIHMMVYSFAHLMVELLAEQASPLLVVPTGLEVGGSRGLYTNERLPKEREVGYCEPSAMLVCIRTCCLRTRSLSQQRSLSAPTPLRSLHASLLLSSHRPTHSVQTPPALGYIPQS